MRAFGGPARRSDRVMATLGRGLVSGHAGTAATTLPTRPQPSYPDVAAAPRPWTWHARSLACARPTNAANSGSTRWRTGDTGGRRDSFVACSTCSTCAARSPPPSFSPRCSKPNRRYCPLSASAHRHPCTADRPSRSTRCATTDRTTAITPMWTLGGAVEGRKRQRSRRRRVQDG